MVIGLSGGYERGEGRREGCLHGFSDIVAAVLGDLEAARREGAGTRADRVPSWLVCWGIACVRVGVDRQERFQTCIYVRRRAGIEASLCAKPSLAKSKRQARPCLGGGVFLVAGRHAALGYDQGRRVHGC